jgi:hypothetical protein
LREQEIKRIEDKIDKVNDDVLISIYFKFDENNKVDPQLILNIIKDRFAKIDTTFFSLSVLSFIFFILKFVGSQPILVEAIRFSLSFSLSVDFCFLFFFLIDGCKRAYIKACCSLLSILIIL